MNEAIIRDSKSRENSKSPPSSAFNMHVMNDEDSENQLFIADTGSINGGTLLLTSEIPSMGNNKLCSQVPHDEYDDVNDIEDEDEEEEDENEDNESLAKHDSLHSSASKILSSKTLSSKTSSTKTSSSGARNKRKNFQPRSIVIVDDAVDDAEDENNYEINSHDDGENEDDTDSDENINGKSSGESSCSSICDSSQVQLQVSSSQQQSIVTSITGIRRSAFQHTITQPSLQQSQQQPLDLSQTDIGTSNGQMISEEKGVHHLSSSDQNNAKSNQQIRLSGAASGATSGATSATHPMDLSRKRSFSEDEGDDEDESGEDDEVIDLRLKDYAESTMNELLGLYGLNRQHNQHKGPFHVAPPATSGTFM